MKLPPAYIIKSLSSDDTKKLQRMIKQNESKRCKNIQSAMKKIESIDYHEVDIEDEGNICEAN